MGLKEASGSDNSEIDGWVWQRQDWWVGLKEAMAMGLVCRSEIVLASWRCRSMAKTMTVRWGWGLNLRHDQTGEGWAWSKIMLLGFEGGGFGIYDFFLFIYGVFMLNFMGLWILFVGGFVVDWKMIKFGFELWFSISGFCGLRKFEKIHC